MQIETERLVLRMFVPEEDAGVMYGRIWTERAVMRYVQPEGWPHPPGESESVLRRVRAFFEEHGFGQWAVVDKTDRRLLGYCGLKFLDNTPEVELLYGIDKDYWNRGLVTEAARASLRYGFEEAGLDHIVAIALPQNTGSWRVMEKLGMRYEGMSRNYNFDVKRYAMRRDEFMPDPDAAYTLRRA